MASGHDRNCSSVFQVQRRKKEGKEVKCVDGRAVGGQDKESVWKCLFLIYMCLCINCPFLFSLISRHKSRQEDDAVDLILLLIVIIGKVSGNL